MLAYVTVHSNIYILPKVHQNAHPTLAWMGVHAILQRTALIVLVWTSILEIFAKLVI